MKTYKYPLKKNPLHKVFRAFEKTSYALLLDNHAICFDPIETFEFKACKPDNTPFEHLHALLNKYTPSNAKDFEHFAGGLAGCFSFDLGHATEHLPSNAKDDLNLPDIMVGVYLKVITIDPNTDQLTFFVTAKDQETADNIYKNLNLGTTDTDKEYTPCALDWAPDKDKTTYKQDIQKTIDYIYAGDIFQACIAQRWTAKLPEGFNAYAHYEHLRAISPAPYACYMNTGHAIISSNSPEQFLKVNLDRTVETSPIKGTCPVDTDPNILLNSEKDRAENTMIVDLLRNDLSKTCTPSSVKVDELCTLKSYANVHHLVSKVSATLKENKTALDLLKTSFPGGSISGAPKIRAMEIIDEIEPVRRGPYCGSMGTIGFNGTMNMNILIRTLIFKKNIAYLYSGGGIVADSDPEAEYQETLTKAQKLFQSFTSTR
ncbi:MAG: anthranilate synthase component I family protein [Bdellovibrionales bacterium]